MKVTEIQNILTSLHHVLHDTCTKHGRGIKTRYFGVDIDFAIRKGLKFYQTRSNAIILQGTLPDCIPKVVRLKTGEVLTKKHTCHLDHQRSLYITIRQKNWVQKKLLDSLEKKLLNNHEDKFLNNQNSSYQPNLSQNLSVIDQGDLINMKSLYAQLLLRGRIEEDIDFKIPGLPHSTVKQLQSANVREFDSEDREPPKSTCTSKRSSTTSTI